MTDDDDSTKPPPPPEASYLDELHIAGRDLPNADYFRVMRCHDHSHAHIVLFHADDTPFAQFTVNHVNVDHIVRECERVFAGEVPGRQ